MRSKSYCLPFWPCWGRFYLAFHQKYTLFNINFNQCTCHIQCLKPIVVLPCLSSLCYWDMELWDIIQTSHMPEKLFDTATQIKFHMCWEIFWQSAGILCSASWLLPTPTPKSHINTWSLVSHNIRGETLVDSFHIWAPSPLPQVRRTYLNDPLGILFKSSVYSADWGLHVWSQALSCSF